jgi:hypothetical protein
MRCSTAKRLKSTDTSRVRWSIKSSGSCASRMLLAMAVSGRFFLASTTRSALFLCVTSFQIADILARVVDENGHQLMDRRRLGRGGGGALESKEQQKEKEVEEHKERAAKEQRERQAYLERQERAAKEQRERAAKEQRERVSSYTYGYGGGSSYSYGGGSSYEDCDSYSSSSRSSGPRCLDDSLDMRWGCNKGLDKWND